MEGRPWPARNPGPASERAASQFRFEYADIFVCPGLRAARSRPSIRTTAATSAFRLLDLGFAELDVLLGDGVVFLLHHLLGLGPGILLGDIEIAGIGARQELDLYHGRLGHGGNPRLELGQRPQVARTLAAGGEKSRNRGCSPGAVHLPSQRTTRLRAEDRFTSSGSCRCSPGAQGRAAERGEGPEFADRLKRRLGSCIALL